MSFSPLKFYFGLLNKSWKQSVAVIFLTLCVLTFLVLLLLGSMDSFPGNTFADGWKMGQLTHYAMEGNPFWKTGEAQLMHGNNSSAGKIMVGNKIRFENPGYLSSSRTVHDLYRPFVGDYVAIHFRQVKIQLTNLNGDRDFRILEVVKTDKSIAPVSCGVITNTTSGARGDGDTVGYLVEVSGRGNFFGSYEAVIQSGNASGTFFALSIPDTDMYNCALSFLKSGVSAKIHYTQSLIRNSLASDTNLQIIGISRLTPATQ